MVNVAQPNQGTATTQSAPYFPPPITKLEDTGLSLLWLQDLTLKIFYYQGYLTGFKTAEELALPFAGIVDQILDSLKREKLIEVKSSQMGLGEGSYQYAITGAGMVRAREALDRSQYAGPAPVPIEVYNEFDPAPEQGQGCNHQPDNAPDSIPPGSFGEHFSAAWPGSQLWHFYFSVWASR